MKQDKQNKLELSMPVQYVKGVGPSRARAFADLGVHTLSDLLEYFPRDWAFMPEPVKINQIHPNETVTIAGVIEQTDFQQFRHTPMFNATIADETGICKVVWFHGGYLRNKLEPGMIILVSGKVIKYKHQLQLTNPKYVILDNTKEKSAEYFSGPVYPASAKISSHQIKKIITPLTEQMQKLALEFYDEPFRKKNNLICRHEAFKQIHNPDNPDKLADAKRRLKYDELFLMQLGLALKRYRMQNFSYASQMKLTDKIDGRIRKRFPFLLTVDQDKVIEEITADMSKPRPMNRLLQGDVGSGKTVASSPPWS